MSFRNDGSEARWEVSPAVEPGGRHVIVRRGANEKPKEPSGLSAAQAREYMERSIVVMSASRQEMRTDSKPSPLVGAVLVRPDGSVDTAFRGELREGDHAEFTLIERKHRPDDLTGSTLFATLEPCAPGSRHMPKLGCAERIVNARIKKVYIGIEDPDPSVAGKGIKHLLSHGVEVEMYPRELQKKIEDANRDFLAAANERAKAAAEKCEPIEKLLGIEQGLGDVALGDLKKALFDKFIKNAGLAADDEDKLKRQLLQIGLFAMDGRNLVPSGIGYLLFGENPQLKFPQARINCLFRRAEYKEDIFTIGGPLLDQPKELFKWYEAHMLGQIDRSEPERRKIFDYPEDVINELMKNAILHRDYEITGAPIYFEINDDAIIIKSPGMPVAPTKLEAIKSFSAPSLSRNPKIMFAFEQMNMAEQRGLGFETVKGLRPKYNIPLPIVSYDDPYLVFTLPRTSQSAIISDYSEDEQKVIEFLKTEGSLKRIEIETMLGYEKKRTNRLIDSLIKKSVVRAIGRGKGTLYDLRDNDSGHK